MFLFNIFNVWLRIDNDKSMHSDHRSLDKDKRSCLASYNLVPSRTSRLMKFTFANWTLKFPVFSGTERKSRALETVLDLLGGLMWANTAEREHNSTL